MFLRKKFHHRQIWPEGRNIVIETSVARNLNLYRIDGTHIAVLDCQPGVNHFYQNSAGVYLVGKRKVLLR